MPDTAELQGVIYTTERVPVYNLSIPGSPTYYVGEHGVWVHNCSIKGFSSQWTKHSANNVKSMWNEVAATGRPQGFWQASKENVFSIVSNALQGGLSGTKLIPIEPGVGKVIVRKANGVSMTVNANYIKVVGQLGNGGGGLKTMHPVFIP